MLHGTPLASAGRAPCFDVGFSLPRAEAFDRTSDTPCRPPASTQCRALFFRRFTALPENLDRALHGPRDGTAAPRSEVPSLDKCSDPPPERRFRPRD